MRDGDRRADTIKIEEKNNLHFNYCSVGFDYPDSFFETSTRPYENAHDRFFTIVDLKLDLH
jgi:hypothetical protein